MKRISIFKILGLAICFYGVVSCQKDEINSSNLSLTEQPKQLTAAQKQQLEDLSNPEQSADVVSRKGRLVFKDLEAFKRVIGELKAMKTEEEVEKWASKFDFIPISKTYQERWKEKGMITKEFCENNQLAFIPDPTFAMILNKDGIYQIGKEVQKITNEKGYAILETKENLLNDLKSTSLRSYEVVSELVKVKKENLRPTNFDGEIGTMYWGPTDLDGNPTLITLEAWNVNYGGQYASFGVRSQNLGPDQLDEISVAAQGYFELNPYLFNIALDSGNFYEGDTEYNSSFVNKTIKWYVSPLPWLGARYVIYGTAYGASMFNGVTYTAGWGLNL